MQLRQLRQLRQLVQILQILQCVQGTYCGGWRRCVCLDAKTRVLAVGALARATCNNFIADLLFLSEVPHSLLVAGPPCVHPYLGEWALLRSLCPAYCPQKKLASGRRGSQYNSQYNSQYSTQIAQKR